MIEHTVSKSSTRFHGLTDHPLYKIWDSIKSRCYNPRVSSYNANGAKGIGMDPHWKNSFISFHNWCINAGWDDGLTIHRKDYLKDYTPDNCIVIRTRGIKKKSSVRGRFNLVV